MLGNKGPEIRTLLPSYGLILTGADAAKPAAGMADRFYWATDTGILYRDTGAAWVETTRGESVTRLAQLAERAHASLTGVTSDLHHAQNHAARHEPGGADIMTVDAVVGTGSLRTLGAGAQQAMPGNATPTPGAHKDTHDPEDGADALDTAIPVKVAAANAIGTSHSLARADHVHEREHAKYLNAEAVSACEAAGLDLATGKNIKLIANLTADNTWSGLSAVLQAGENLTITQLVYVKAADGKMWKAKADAAATMPAIAMACGTIAANAWGEFLLIGFFRDDGTLTFTLGDMLYVSDTVAGAFDNVLPADTGEQVQVLGKCLITTHIIYFNPSLELVEIA